MAKQVSPRGVQAEGVRLALDRLFAIFYEAITFSSFIKAIPEPLLQRGQVVFRGDDREPITRIQDDVAIRLVYDDGSETDLLRGDDRSVFWVRKHDLLGATRLASRSGRVSPI